jgi:hypothetical protein
MHNDYLDSDRHNNPYSNDEDQPDPPEMAWHLSRLQNGKETILGTFSPFDGQDVMGCDMDEWMRENDHYGAESPGDYEWDGDSESVAIMAKREGMPEYRFEWRAIAFTPQSPQHTNSLKP